MKNNFFYFFLIVFGVLISNVAQIFLKKSAIKRYNSIIKEYINWRVITAYLIFGFVVILNSFAMRVLDLSFVVLIGESLTFIFAIISGKVFFNEKITIKKIIGSIFIIIGILFYSVSLINL